MCSCTAGWGGADCGAPACADECGGRGVCVAPGQCSCFDGWGGASCGVAQCASECSGRGNCTAPGECSCADGWGGHDCSEPQCEGGCAGHGACVRRASASASTAGMAPAALCQRHTRTLLISSAARDYGATATAAARRRAARASTAGAARSARRLSARPTARATAGARAPERVGWEVAACEQPTCHPVCEHGTCTRHGERASCACFEGWQGVRSDVPSLPIELSSAWSVHGARMCLLEPVHVFLYSCIMTCIMIYHVVS